MMSRYLHTPGGALNYLVSCGWQFDKVETLTNGSVTSGLGGSIHTQSYWIMRKPCTKEELDSLVQKGIDKSVSDEQ